MARRTPPRNELQDPSLPQRQRARWRVIGAAVLALAAVVMLPLALESEPKQSLNDVAISIPQRASLDQGRSWLERRDSDVVPSDAPVGDEASPAPVARVEIAPPETKTLPVPPKPGAAAPAGIPSDGGDAARSAAAIAAAEAAAKAAKAASEAGPGKDGDSGARQAASQNAAKPEAANAAVAARASERGQKSASEKPPPPMPERRRDRNAVKAASPSGYVVQIGAFSTRKGARTQIERARKLGFEAYTETITTKKGDRIRVRVGPYLTREQANVARARLRSEGLDTVLIAP